MANTFTALTILAVAVSMAPQMSETESLMWEDETPFPAVQGCAAYYSDNVMSDTAIVRGEIDKRKEYDKWLEQNGYIGAVAVYRKGDLGRDLHILWPNGIIDGPYYALDVVAEHHYQLGLNRNRVVDVDFATAQRHDMRGPVSVVVFFDIEWITDYGIAEMPEWEIDKYGDCLK